MAGEDDWDSSHVTTLAKPGFLKSKRKNVRMSSYLDCNRSDQAVTIAYDYSSLSRMKSLKQAENGLKHPTKELLHHKVPNGYPVHWSAVNQPFGHGEAYEEAFFFETGTSDGSSRGGKKLKSGDGFKTGKSRFGFDYKVSSLKAPLQRMASHLQSDYRIKSVQGNIGASSHQGANMKYSVHGSNDSKSEETYSDSFEHVGDCGNLTPYESKSLYPGADIEVCQSAACKLKEDHKKLSKQPRNNGKLSPPSVGRTSAQTVPPYAKRAKKKLKTTETDYLDDGKQIREGLVTNSSEKLRPTPVDSIAIEKKRKGKQICSILYNQLTPLSIKEVFPKKLRVWILMPDQMR
ncbi:hypothetical protein HPP92_000626 [Vanilla planifolia]|uniref:Uncharacterized protein n=1 Tax=Vanilla planifolia TaxID=51239 RepID=A0A835VG80_VANPL|nr:hypothetical protein HPP92_000704 [Vanilla planifolia]KAG0500554.1 hypothetical protein HPP92_000626 [Vanilla planifolia]